MRSTGHDDSAGHEVVTLNRVCCHGVISKVFMRSTGHADSACHEVVTVNRVCCHGVIFKAFMRSTGYNVVQVMRL
jgi:hypothetical protein